MAKISKAEFQKALLALEEAQAECDKQDVDSKAYKLFRDATIQRFEFCVELSWKVSIKTLGLTSTSPKPALREMLRAQVISKIEPWFDYVEARNKSSHTYDEEIAKEVYSVVASFIADANILICKI
jgi:nucleotidyltransferase substrate binding protein (TIGR01987 family)